MAKENTVYLHGRVAGQPKVYYSADGEFKKAAIELTVIRRPFALPDGRVVGEGRLRTDTPMIITGDAALGGKIGELRQHDMVDVKGVLTTREVAKITPCGHCGHKNTALGTSGFVTAIYVCRREHGIGEEKALELLHERREVSNTAVLIGTLCREPRMHETEDGKTAVTQYQLAVNRRYHIREEFVPQKTDYPWVKSFGQQAKDDYQALSVNSTVLVNGAVQTREFKRITECAGCGQEYEWDDRTIEVVPYRVQYLMNCSPPHPGKLGENTVHLHGQVMAPPKVSIGADGAFRKATAAIKVLRRPYVRSNGRISGGKLRIDALIVSTSDASLAERISGLQQHDMVDVKGSLAARETAKPTECPSCGQSCSEPGNFGLIVPSYVCRRETGIDAARGMELLRERSEVSNTAIVAGELLADPDAREPEGGRDAACYQLTVRRMARGGGEAAPDMPWARSSGRQALEDSARLAAGSNVLINGTVQVREGMKDAVCAACGAQFRWPDKTVELSPHAVEYLMGCRFDERGEDGEDPGQGEGLDGWEEE